MLLYPPILCTLNLMALFSLLFFSSPDAIVKPGNPNLTEALERGRHLFITPKDVGKLRKPKGDRKSFLFKPTAMARPFKTDGRGNLIRPANNREFLNTPQPCGQFGCINQNGFQWMRPTE